MALQTSFREIARAKINLSLKVRGKRPDGFHELESLVAFAETPVDALVLRPGCRDDVVLDGPFAKSIDSENLVARALSVVKDLDSRLRAGSVVLEKQIPVAAGLGGGSADVGALLRALRRANCDFDEVVDWLEVSRALGSDVPVCFTSRPAVMLGRGDRVHVLNELSPLSLVLVNPMVEMPDNKTGRVYGALGADDITDAVDRSAPPVGLDDRVKLISYMQHMGNDLEDAARWLVPEIATIKSALMAQQGCQYAGLSGSGPTCFGVFDMQSDAETAARAIQRSEPGWWVCSTRLCAGDGDDY